MWEMQGRLSRSPSALQGGRSRREGDSSYTGFCGTCWSAVGLVNEKLPEYFREVRPEVFAQTYKGFKLTKVVDGVPMLRQELAVVEVERYVGTELPWRIYIRAFDRSAKPEFIATLYEQTLLEEHIPYDRCKRISFTSTEIADTHLIIAVSPSREVTPEKASVLSENAWRRRPSFPPPSLQRFAVTLNHTAWVGVQMLSFRRSIQKDDGFH